MEPVSVAIITRDEEENIARCLESVSWAEDVVVVDNGSTDGTLDICARYPCRVVESEWLGYARTKQLAVDSALHDWVLILDADEQANEGVERAVRRALENPVHAGYRVGVRTYYLGRLIRYCGWGGERHLRLFNRRRGGFDDKPVHESIRVEGTVGDLEATLLHFSYPRLETHVDKMNRYSGLGAEARLRRGASASLGRAWVSGAAKFLKMYVLQRGFLDGKAGLVLSVNSAFGVWLKYAKVWEAKRRDRSVRPAEERRSSPPRP